MLIVGVLTLLMIFIAAAPLRASLQNVLRASAAESLEHLQCQTRPRLRRLQVDQAMHADAVMRVCEDVGVHLPNQLLVRRGMVGC